MYRHSILKDRKSALLFMVLASGVASFSGLLIRNIQSASPDQINIYRSIFFTAVVTLGFAIRNKKSFSNKSGYLNPPVIWASLCLGATGLLVPYALTMTTIANNAFAMSATPFISMFLAFVFLGERISRATLIAMAFASGGIILMIFDGLGRGTTTGDVLAILVAIGFSTFAVILRANKDLEMTPCLFGAGLIVIAGSIISNNDGYAISQHDLILCLIWGSVLSGIVHWIFVIAAKYLLASELTLFTLFEFALAPAWVWIFLSEKPENMALVGGSIVICSVGIRALAELFRQQQKITYAQINQSPDSCLNAKRK
ncbi:MAG: DMT family transporter [Pseudomonadota bacterium]